MLGVFPESLQLLICLEFYRGDGVVPQKFNTFWADCSQDPMGSQWLSEIPQPSLLLVWSPLKLHCANQADCFKDRLPTLSASQALLELSSLPRKPISTALRSLDAILQGQETGNASQISAAGGLSRGQVTEVYGPPGVGKTTFAYVLEISLLTFITVLVFNFHAVVSSTWFTHYCWTVCKYLRMPCIQEAVLFG